MMKNPQQTVYFLHLRKTAGTSLMKMIKASSHTPDVISVDGFRDYFNYASSHPKTDIIGRMVRTHSYYGIHLMNFNHFINKNQYTYMTVLRDPIERAISYYYYVKRHRPKKHEHPDSAIANRFDLKDFYQHTNKDNGQTKILSGAPSRLFDHCNSWILNLAKKNLASQFALVGITERFDETVNLINQTFDWQLDVNIPNAKVNPNRPKQNDLTEETLSSLRYAHQFDIQLYEFAKELFEKQVRILKDSLNLGSI